MNTSTSGSRLFLSHSSHDKSFTSKLIVALREAGVEDPWYDVFDLDAATVDIAAALREGVSAADRFALVLSPASADSHWVTYEVAAAVHSDAPTLVLLYDSPDGANSYLGNPHLNDLLNGGRRKVVDFTTSFERALAELLFVIDPAIGERYDTEFTMGQILDEDDPDVAERAMAHAALFPDRFLPPLLEKLPSLRNDRRLRFRVEGAFCAIGRQAVGPLLQFLLRQLPPAEHPQLPAPDVAPADRDDEGNLRYVGNAAIDLLRHMILSGGDRVWSAQLGAEYVLTAIAGRDPALRRVIAEDLATELSEATSRIASERDHGAAAAELFDVLRLAIETFGLVGEPGEDNSFLVHQFATTALWGWQAKEAKNRLGRYVTSCLARMGTEGAMRHLSELIEDGEFAELWFGASRNENPWSNAYVDFGAGAVDQLLGMRSSVPDEFLPFLYSNLARIPNPRGLRATLEWVSEGAGREDDLAGTSLLIAVAGQPVPSAADELLAGYSSGAFDHFADGPFEDRLPGAAVVAGHNAGNRELAAEVCADLIDSDDAHLRFELAKTIPAIRAESLYETVRGWVSDDPSPLPRASAAIALSRFQILREPDPILAELTYAEADWLAPQLGVALSYFGEEAAIEPLGRGLRKTFLAFQEDAHETYAEALERIDSDDARLMRSRWHRRI